MLGRFTLPKTFYIRIDGYCSTVYGLYEVEADTYEEAIQMAKDAFVKQYEVYEIGKKDIEELEQELGKEREVIKKCMPY